MSYTYGGDLGTSNRDLVRFLLGDTAGERWSSAADNEIDYYLKLNTDPTTGEVYPYQAASEVAAAMANKFTALNGTTSVKIGTMALDRNYGAMADAYRTLSLKLLEGRSGVQPGAAIWNDQPEGQFSIGIMDNPSFSGDSYNRRLL